MLSVLTADNAVSFCLVLSQTHIAGRGAFSVVKQGKNKKTGAQVAIKYIEKKFVQEKHIEQLRREIAIMNKVDHKNVSAYPEDSPPLAHILLVFISTWTRSRS